MPNHSRVTPFVVEGRTIRLGGPLWVGPRGDGPLVPALAVGFATDGLFAYVEIKGNHPDLPGWYEGSGTDGTVQVSPQQCRLTCETCDDPITRKRLSLTGWSHVVSGMVPCGGPDPAHTVLVNDETVTRYEHDNIYRYDPMAFAHPA